MVTVDGELEGEGRLERRFVPTGEALAGVGGLELGGCQLALIAFVVGEAAQVGPDELVVELPVEVDIDHDPTGLQGRGGTKREPFELGVELVVATGAGVAGLPPQGDRVDGQAIDVQ